MIVYAIEPSGADSEFKTLGSVSTVSPEQHCLWRLQVHRNLLYIGSDYGGAIVWNFEVGQYTEVPPFSLDAVFMDPAGILDICLPNGVATELSGSKQLLQVISLHGLVIISLNYSLFPLRISKFHQRQELSLQGMKRTLRVRWSFVTHSFNRSGERRLGSFSLFPCLTCPSQSPWTPIHHILGMKPRQCGGTLWISSVSILTLLA